MSSYWPNLVIWGMSAKSLYYSNEATMIVQGLSERIAVSAWQMLTTAQAVVGEPKSRAWYEVITGVIAIPAALIGLAYSYLLIKKTRLEARKTELDSRKTELEILEKERQLAQLGASSSSVRRVVAATIPARENRLTILLLIRFVVLYLIITAWGVVEDAFNVLFTGMVIGAQQIFSLTLSGWIVIPLVDIQNLPKVAYWLVFFSLAWPLFRDANAALGIDIKNFLKVSSLRKRWRQSEPPDG